MTEGGELARSGKPEAFQCGVVVSRATGGTGLGVRDGAVGLEFGRLRGRVGVPAQGEYADAAVEAPPS